MGLLPFGDLEPAGDRRPGEAFGLRDVTVARTLILSVGSE
jgi:hypothetical protein